jgi:aerobic carbon-monoxide dehydrogenase large subunit
MANVIGQRVRRREDPRFLRGEGKYVDNIKLAGELQVVFVRSPMAHAKIVELDVSAARELPGVKVFTAADTTLEVSPPPPFIGIDPQMFRPFMASDTVRFAGDIVAAVLAETKAEAVDAAEYVSVDYEPLPVVTDPREAAKDEILLYPGVGTNTCVALKPEADPNLFADSDVVVEGTLISQRLAASPLEPRSSLAEVGDDDRLTIWLSTQTPHQDRMGLSMLLGMEESQIRVVGPDVGGGFGAKGLNVEDVMVGWLARELGRPVHWTETRSENMVAMNQGRAQVADFKIGATRDGEVKALKLDLLQDAGAYPSIGAFLPNLTALMASGVYRIPKIETSINTVVTNTTPIGPFRGAGRPEASQILERAMDMLAAELDLDPAEIRRRNFIPADAFPYTTVSGARYDSGDYAGALDLALESAGYDELREEQRRRREEGGPLQLGIGLCVYVEVTNGLHEKEFGAVEITEDGQAILRTGSFSHGQGHETTFAMIAAEQLGMPIENVQVSKGDTDIVPRGTGTYGSKSTQIGGAAALEAADEVVERAKRLAADLLEAAPEDLVLDLDAGRFHVAGAPQSGFSWNELAAKLKDDGRLSELSVERDFEAEFPTFPFGAHVAVVEVDVETGSVKQLRHISVDDAGRIISPVVAEGQVHGGVATGIAQALFEEVMYDEDGNPVTGSFASYCFPAATEMPSFERITMVTLTPLNPLGAKGIGESGTIGATPASHNAVIDALKPYGVRHVDMPANGERVWRAIQEARG